MDNAIQLVPAFAGCIVAFFGGVVGWNFSQITKRVEELNALLRDHAVRLAIVEERSRVCWRQRREEDE